MATEEQNIRVNRPEVVLFDSPCLLQQPVDVWSFICLLIHLLLSEYQITILLGLCFSGENVIKMQLFASLEFFLSNQCHRDKTNVITHQTGRLGILKILM